MAMTPRLTWLEEKRLQILLGNASLSLLYKQSAHGCSIQKMVQRCIDHIPEIVDDSEKQCASIFFIFQKDSLTVMSTLLLNLLKVTSDYLEFCSSDKLNFWIYPKKRVFRKPDRSVNRAVINSSTDLQYLECEVFRVEGMHKNKLLADLRAYKPHADLVSKIRILLLGPVGSGKSSFFNSVKSVFHGHTTRQAPEGSDNTSITEQYRIYPVKDGKDGQYLPFMLCDSMGLDDTDDEGLCVDDIPYIIKGCVPDRYHFNPFNPITPKHPTFITSPSLKDQIHCVAYVLDINSIKSLSSEMVAKLKQIHEEVLKCGESHHIKNFSFWNNLYNFLNMTKRMTSWNQVKNAVCIPLSNILMVRNYASERELDPMKDVLILSALRQMLRAADDFLEDLPLEETGKLSSFCSSCKALVFFEKTLSYTSIAWMGPD
uniref:Interferon induced protein 44 like n=1 Tax=Spermophilus dauricus TaxID=99837 RepID=A0A8C9QBE1_SPEDA